MAKKRKASRQAQSTPHKSVVDSDAQLRIKTFEDVADSEDEFHLNEDKVLLEELPESKRQRLKYGAGMCKTTAIRL